MHKQRQKATDYARTKFGWDARAMIQRCHVSQWTLVATNMPIIISLTTTSSFHLLFGEMTLILDDVFPQDRICITWILGLLSWTHICPTARRVRSSESGDQSDDLSLLHAVYGLCTDSIEKGKWRGWFIMLSLHAIYVIINVSLWKKEMSEGVGYILVEMICGNGSSHIT